MREKRPVIALDFPTFGDVKTFLAKFPADEKLYVKIGDLIPDAHVNGSSGLR